MKRLITPLIFAASLLAHSAVFAQTQQHPCSTDENYQQQLIDHPEMRAVEARMNALYSATNAQFKNEDTVTYVIPIVFHIIHNNGREKLSKTVINQQMITLNEAFNKNNADTINIRGIFKPLATNARIKFELATHDQWGRCTDGIDYVESPLTSNASDNVKPLAWWDNSRYLNVWVAGTLSQPSGIQGILVGYAQFPWQSVSRSSTDGILITASFIGRNQKSLVHEIGHYLGLYHPFQDGCSEDQNMQGDQVNDTPPVKEASFGWNLNANTCHQDNPDMPDMIENYMDYANRSYLFTPNQVIRMRSYLRGVRRKLISTDNYQVTLSQCANTAIDPSISPIASFEVYPNPAKEQFSVSLRLLKSEDCRIEVLDLTGKTIKTIQTRMTAGNTQQIKISTDRLTPSSVYFLRVTTPSSVMTKKVVIQ